MAGTTPTTTPWKLTFDRQARIKAAIVAAAFIAVFWKLLDFVPPRLGDVVYKWVTSSDWSHGPIIPLFSAYLVYMKWDQIRRCRISHTWVGLVILVAGLAFYAYSLLLGQFGYPRPLAMMVCLLGVIILLCGLPVMRYAWVPWLYLLFAIPIPQRIHFMLTNPLRQLAASVATTILGLIRDLDIQRNGSVIDAFYKGNTYAIGVADACSGMRSTITLCALGVAITFISDRPWWQRVILLAACLPIAVFCNFIRVLITTWLYIFVDERYATGTYHTLLGLAMLGLAFSIFSGIGWVLKHLVIEGHDDQSAITNTAAEK